MAKSTTATKKIEEIQDFAKELKAVNVKKNPVERSDKKAECRFSTVICADYGTFMPGETGSIPQTRAKELAALGKCEILRTEE